MVIKRITMVFLRKGQGTYQPVHNWMNMLLREEAKKAL